MSPPGVLPAITEVLPKDRPAIPILYSSAESHLEMVRKLTRPSIVAIASVNEHFLTVARGLLGPVVGTLHTVTECRVTGDEAARIPTADVLFSRRTCVCSLTRSPARKERRPVLSPD